MLEDNPWLLIALPCRKTGCNIGSPIIRGKPRIESRADMPRVHITTATKPLASFEDVSIISRTKEGIPVHDVSHLDRVGME